MQALYTLLSVTIVLWILTASKTIIITTAQRVFNVMEIPYAEGQRDAINGDIRLNVKRDCWTISPWDNGAIPAIKPMCN